MADATATGAEDAASQRAAEQARLRKERREAKIRAGGSARLNKITGINGGVQRDPIPAFSSTPAAGSPALTPLGSPKPTSDDPPAIDISQHFYTPTRRPGAESRDGVPPISEGQGLDNELLRQMMLGGLGGTPPASSPGAGRAAAQDLFAAAADNPIMKALLEQMGGSENLFASLRAGQKPGGGPQAPTYQPEATEDSLVHLWKIAHALFAVALGICIVFLTTFSGTKLEREQAALAARQRVDQDWAGQLDEQDLEAEWVAKVFWAWAAAEAMLLTGRFLLFDSGRGGGGGSGIAAMADQVLGAFLSPGVRGAVRVTTRYFRWILAIRADLAVVVFVLGLCTWFRGG